MQDLRIAMVQMNSRVAEHERNLATIARFTEQAAAQDVDIVCFPELCVCGYNVGDPSTLEPEPLKGDSLRRLEEISGDHEITVLAGFLERDVSGIVYNTQVICGPRGYVGHYRKTHVPDVEIGTFCHGQVCAIEFVWVRGYQRCPSLQTVRFVVGRTERYRIIFLLVFSLRIRAN